MWEMTAEILYKNIDITGDQLFQLLVPSKTPSKGNPTGVGTWSEFMPPLRNRFRPLSPVSESRLRQYHLPRPGRNLNDLSPRMRRALSFIRQLSIRNLTQRAVDLIADSTLSYTVLFPSVTKLHLWFTTPIPMLSFSDSFIGVHAAIWRAFNTLDVCIWELGPNNALSRDSYRHLEACPYGDHILPCLWITKIQTMSVHTNRLMNFNGFPAPGTVKGPVYWFINDTLALQHIGRHRAPEPEPTSKRVRCLIGSQSSADSIALARANVRLATKAQYLWAGMAPPAPLTVTGPWDEKQKPLHQFRADTPEHPPCFVCGGKFEFNERHSGHVWTTTKD